MFLFKINPFIFFLLSCQSTKSIEPKKMLENDAPQEISQKLEKLNFKEVLTAETSDSEMDALKSWQSYLTNSLTIEERRNLLNGLEGPFTNESLSSLLVRGQKSLEVNLLSQAEEAFKKALRIEASNPKALIGLASVGLRKNDLQQTAELMNQLSEVLKNEREKWVRNGTYLQYQYLRASFYLVSGSENEGKRILSQLIEKEKGFIPAYLTLSQFYLKEKKLSLSEYILKKCLDSNPDSLEASSLLAQVKWRQNEEEQALNLIAKVLERNPSFIPAILLKAHLHMAAFEFDKAEDLLNKISVVQMYNPSFLLSFSLLEKNKKNFEKAEAYLRRSLELNPLFAQARFELAKLRGDVLKDKYDAIRLLREVVEQPNIDSELKAKAQVSLDQFKAEKF